MSAAQASHPLSVLDGKYALLRPLGSGGTGTVYEAEHLIVGKRVAIKLMSSGTFSAEDSQARFVTEARAAARIAHANVVDIHDLGVTREGVPYLVMELLRGETLEAIIDERGPLAPAYACELFLQVLAGLSAAHAQGIVHCDLKPGNVLVTHPRPDRPLVKVLDFGIARGVEAASSHERPGVVLGTPMYMSPEQVTGEPVDFRSDVYQATAMLFAMLAGSDPFDFVSTRELMKLVAKGRRRDLAALAPELPKELIDVVSDGMHVKRSERIQSAEELAERLRPFVSSAHFVSLVPQKPQVSSQPIPLIVGPGAEASRASAPPDKLGSVIPVRMPMMARMTDSLLVSPRIPRAPSTPKLRLGQDFMPMPDDPNYQELVDARRSQTYAPRRRGSFRRDVMPALIATGFGFGLGVILAWSAGLI